MLDDVARYNRDRWQALVEAGVSFSRPWLDLDEGTARERLDPEGRLGDATDRDVLCLAGGGGQQSVAFSLLGARVSVLDLSPGQLERDRDALAHHGLEARLVEGDMRDLSAFENDAFDLVWHAHALAFIPDPRPVFDEVARVLRPGGRYRLYCTNPFTHGLWDREWGDDGYPLGLPYVDGAELTSTVGVWDVKRPDGTSIRMKGPRQWRHTLSTLVNELVARGFRIDGVWETSTGDAGAEPGSWDHYKAVAPPWLTFWASRGLAPGTD